MDITLTQLLILSLASFRLTRLFVYDKITEGFRSRFFTEMELDGEIYLKPKGFIGELLSCHWCTGFWCTVIIFILQFILLLDFIILILAVAAIASIIQWVMDRD
jgi:hypothetical protein